MLRVTFFLYRKKTNLCTVNLPYCTLKELRYAANIFMKEVLFYGITCKLPSKETDSTHTSKLKRR